MSVVGSLRFEFVDFIPESLEDGTLYISTAYATASHNCCCGCGTEVVTPLSPTGWTLSYDGASVSLDPSIGNWDYPCRSHYFIRRNAVRWASQLSREEIEAGRERDRRIRERYYESLPTEQEVEDVQPKEGFWQRLKRWFS